MDISNILPISYKGEREGEAPDSLPIETITRLKEEQFQNEKTFHKIKGKTIQMQETTDPRFHEDKFHRLHR
ncbi:MAG: hypothetical protein A2Z57_11560 [Planctomycetes bacterium RIFCSPHIGHO2_12_39_6]|nr:MAG: hypothetical protein A2Z57_11560 [Planctomycetes bacterium RIFCSPHIGHO2_12_39_6]